MGSLLGFDNEEHLIVPSASSSDLILLREIARLKQQQLLLQQLNRGGTHIHNQHCSCLSLNMEEEEKEEDQGHILSQHFKALSILHRQTPTTRLHTVPHSNFERFNQTVRSGSMALLPDDPFIIHNNNNGAAHHLRQADPNYYHHFLIKPSQMEIDSYLIRSMALEQQQQQQQQHNRLLNHRIINPPFNINNGNTTTTPTTAAAAAFRGSGTGVFHPRINVNVTPPIPTTSTFTKRKPTGPRIRPERYNTGQWSSSTTNAAMDKQNDTYNHLPSEMGLPRDWTY